MSESKDENEELEQIRKSLIDAGIATFCSPLRGVNLLRRLLDQSQKENLSLRKRIHELLSYFPGGQPPQSQQPQPSEVHPSAVNKSAEGSTPKPEG